MHARLRFAWLLPATMALASCPSTPAPNGPRTLWLDAPKDGELVLVDHEPPPF